MEWKVIVFAFVLRRRTKNSLKSFGAKLLLRLFVKVNGWQGDQIRRIFARCGDSLLWVVVWHNGNLSADNLSANNLPNVIKVTTCPPTTHPPTTRPLVRLG
jgi:hypothetical protein